MEFTPLRLPGAFVITMVPHTDHRGYFKRVYDETGFHALGLQTNWRQDNESQSEKTGTIRGLHYQSPPHNETKFVRAATGAIYDVLVDLRKSSPTFGQWEGVELTEENHKAVYVPKGFAHGFCTLTPDARVMYKVDEDYAPAAEGGIRYDDPTLAIDWPSSSPTISDKDNALPLFDPQQTPFE